MKGKAEEIKDYWDQRARSDSSAQSTTMDVWLREIEARVVRDAISAHIPSTVMDLGCGDGRTTLKCAETFPAITFHGFDYAAHMIGNAKQNLFKAKLENVFFDVGDVLDEIKYNADFIFTTRCLINLTSWDAQQKAIKNIRDCLAADGIYLMIENFVESQAQFNCIREEFSLPEIPIRDHNLFFERDILMSFLKKNFDVISEVNISSQYYLVSRVIYSSICAALGVEPDYNDIHHELASRLPFLGEFGPTRALTLRKKP